MHMLIVKMSHMLTKPLFVDRTHLLQQNHRILTEPYTAAGYVDMGWQPGFSGLACDSGGNDSVQVWEDGLDEAQSDVVFEHRVVDIPLPLRRATLTDVQNAKRAIRDYVQDKDGDIDYNDVAHMQVHLGILKRFEVQDKMDNILVESHFIRLGSIAIATNPFELFLDYGNQIKARSVCEQTFLIQLANGSDGYLPTAKAEAGGHYSAFLSSGQVGHVGGEMLVRQTLDQIRDLFKA